MRITHVSTYDCEGGASRSAYRLHDGLRRQGCESQMFVARKASNDPSVICYESPKDALSQVTGLVRRLRILLAVRRYSLSAPAGIRAFGDDRTKYGKRPWQCLPDNDLIHLHWVTRFVDYGAFFCSLPATTPVVWTLHDMVPFTGGCHYDQGCHRFAKNCGSCPQLGSQSDRDLTRRVWQRKWESFHRIRSRQLHLVTPSRWLSQEVAQSSLLSRFPRSVIPYGLDTEVFAPRDCLVSRKLLGIPSAAKVVLFLAHGIDEPRKGLHHLELALRDIKSVRDVFLLSVGSGVPANLPEMPNAHIERVDDDFFLSHVYSAADLLVVPSLQDNLPNILLESISCGTPVVAFAVGGISDVVRPGSTGLLAASGDTLGLREAIVALLKNEQGRKAMRLHCRKTAMQEYTLEIQAKRYLQLYEQLLRSQSSTMKELSKDGESSSRTEMPTRHAEVDVVSNALHGLPSV